MRRYISLSFGLAIVVFIGGLGGCSQSPIGVFESIELETKIDDPRELDNELLVGAIAESANHYFIAAATLWHRLADETDWRGDLTQWVSIASPGPENSNHTTSSLAVFDGSGTELVYAAYSSQDGTDGGVYPMVYTYEDVLDENGKPVLDESDAVRVELVVTAGVSVFDTTLADVAGVGKVFVADDGTASQLLVGVRKTTTSRYSLYTSTTAAALSFTEVVGSEGNLPVIDVAEASTGEVAMLTRKAILVDSDGLNAGAPPVDVASNLDLGDRQPEFGGIYYHAATDTLWVTDNEGYLYHSPDFGATWVANTPAHPVSTDNETALAFTDMTSVNNGGTELLLVGTEGHGYWELGVDFQPVTPDAEVSNYQASELARATILALFVDTGSAGDLLFAGTSNLGLWKVLYDGSDPQWVRE